MFRRHCRRRLLSPNDIDRFWSASGDASYKARVADGVASYSIGKRYQGKPIAFNNEIYGTNVNKA
jgi:hypothetical protein